MSQLAYSAVGMDFQPVPATLSLDEPDNTARALCVELARVTGSRRSLRDVLGHVACIV